MQMSVAVQIHPGVYWRPDLETVLIETRELWSAAQPMDGAYDFLTVAAAAVRALVGIDQIDSCRHLVITEVQ